MITPRFHLVFRFPTIDAINKIGKKAISGEVPSEQRLAFCGAQETNCVHPLSRRQIRRHLFPQGRPDNKTKEGRQRRRQISGTEKFFWPSSLRKLPAGMSKFCRHSQ